MRVLCAVDADLGLHATQKFQCFFRLLGLVPLVVLPEDLVGRGVDHRRLHRGRANVEPYQEFSVVVVGLLKRSRRDLKQLGRFGFVSGKMVVHAILRSDSAKRSSARTNENDQGPATLIASPVPIS